MFNGCVKLIHDVTNTPVNGREIIDRNADTVAFIPDDILIPGEKYTLRIYTSKVYNTNGFMKMHYETHCKVLVIKCYAQYTIRNSHPLILKIRHPDLNELIDVRFHRRTENFIKELIDAVKAAIPNIAKDDDLSKYR